MVALSNSLHEFYWWYFSRGVSINSFAKMFFTTKLSLVLLKFKETTNQCQLRSYCWLPSIRL